MHSPLLVNALPWKDIELHFEDLKSNGWNVDPMLELLNHIVKDRVSQRLFAYTALDTIVISIYDPLEPDREALHVQFDHIIQQWIFRYFAKPFQPVEWEKTYPADKGIEKFTGFIKMIGW